MDEIEVRLNWSNGEDELRRVFQEIWFKRIAHLGLERSVPDDREGDGLHIVFADGTGICVFDDGQSCCEHRYMTTDDDLAAFEGATLVGIRLAEARNRTTAEGEDDVHEVQFLLVDTSLGTFTLETHNEHNGYYGGFDVVVRPLEK